MPEEWDTFVTVEEDLIQANVKLAEENAKFFKERGIRVFEILGNIGSGKTTMIEKMVQKLKDKYKILVINGDLATSIDADRIARHGVKAIQLNTGRECHLDAYTMRPALEKLPDINLCLIEQVGNMICPADFPLGAEKRIVVFSITNGPYIVKKHPLIFTQSSDTWGADMVVINKLDIAEAVDMNEKAREQLVKDCKDINPKLEVLFVSAKTGEGIDELIKALGL
ncbi:MAG: hydrogenase nickel incorporation protein HypB [Candidatus Helarchaeales archaeon]